MDIRRSDEVASCTLGRSAGLVVAAALLVDNIVVGLGRAIFGHAPVAESTGWQIHAEQTGLSGSAT